MYDYIYYYESHVIWLQIIWITISILGNMIKKRKDLLLRKIATKAQVTLDEINIVSHMNHEEIDYNKGTMIGSSWE